MQNYAVQIIIFERLSSQLDFSNVSHRPPTDRPPQCEDRHGKGRTHSWRERRVNFQLWPPSPHTQQLFSSISSRHLSSFGWRGPWMCRHKTCGWSCWKWKFSDDSRSSFENEIEWNLLLAFIRRPNNFTEQFGRECWHFIVVLQAGDFWYSNFRHNCQMQSVSHHLFAILVFAQCFPFFFMEDLSLIFFLNFSVPLHHPALNRRSLATHCVTFWLTQLSCDDTKNVKKAQTKQERERKKYEMNYPRFLLIAQLFILFSSYFSVSLSFFILSFWLLLSSSPGNRSILWRRKILSNIFSFNFASDSSLIQVHPCGRYRHNTVVFILAKEYNLKNLRTIHRLDRLTSGLLLFGRSPKKARQMEHQIRNRQVQKQYVCRVEGEFPE